MDWTIAVDQHLLVVSLIVGRRAVPMSWCASDASVLQGRLKRYALAVIRRAVGRVAQAVGKRRVIVTAVGVLLWAHCGVPCDHGATTYPGITRVALVIACERREE